MNKSELLELRNRLQDFEEGHSLELLDNETESLNTMLDMLTEYINGYDGE